MDSHRIIDYIDCFAYISNELRKIISRHSCIARFKLKKINIKILVFLWFAIFIAMQCSFAKSGVSSKQTSTNTHSQFKKAQKLNLSRTYPVTSNKEAEDSNQKNKEYFYFEKDFSLDKTKHPVIEKKLSNTRFIKGNKVEVDGKELILINEVNKQVFKKGIEVLQEGIKRDIDIITFLEEKLDKVTIRKIKEKWGAGIYDGWKEHGIKYKFSTSYYKRFVLVGHIEKEKNGESYFVINNQSGQSKEKISILQLQKYAKKYQKELIFIGCKTFKSGASAGLLENLPSESVPEILENIKKARNRLELYAAISQKENPVFIDLQKFLKELANGAVEIYRVDSLVPKLVHYGINSETESLLKEDNLFSSYVKEQYKPSLFDKLFEFIFSIVKYIFYAFCIYAAVILALRFFQICIFSPFYCFFKFQNNRYGTFSRSRKVFYRLLGSTVDKQGRLMICDNEFLTNYDNILESDNRKKLSIWSVMSFCIVGFILGIVTMFKGEYLLSIILIIPALLIFLTWYLEDINEEYEHSEFN